MRGRATRSDNYNRRKVRKTEKFNVFLKNSQLRHFLILRAETLHNDSYLYAILNVFKRCTLSDK